MPRSRGGSATLPVGLLLASLALLGIAAARPQLTEDVPTNRTSIILALDESGSMCSTDLHPEPAGRRAASGAQFVAHEPPARRSASSCSTASPSSSWPRRQTAEALEKAINNLTTGPGTAIGAAILQSLDAISQVDPKVASVGAAATIGRRRRSNPFGQTARRPSSSRPSAHRRDGYVPDVVVLLTDGANNRGIAPCRRRRTRSSDAFASTRSASERHIRGRSPARPHNRAGSTSAVASAPGGGFGGAGSGAWRGFGRNPLVADLHRSRRSPG